MGLGQFNISQDQLKNLSDAELAMHCQYMEDRYKQVYKMKFDCKLPLDVDSYELINVSRKTQNEFKKIFKGVMEDKITEANDEFMKREMIMQRALKIANSTTDQLEIKNTGSYVSNVKKMISK